MSRGFICISGAAKTEKGGTRQRDYANERERRVFFEEISELYWFFLGDAIKTQLCWIELKTVGTKVCFALLNYS